MRHADDAGVSVVRPGVAEPRADRSRRRSACRSPRWTPAARATSSHPGVTGLLSADPAGFSRDLARLASDERLRAALGAAARADAHARFSAPSVVERVEQVYRGAAAAARRLTHGRAPSRRRRRARGHAAARRRRPRAIGPRSRAASGGAAASTSRSSRRRRAASAGRRRPIRSRRRASRSRHVPYVTFPFANRRGTTILDRSTAYPCSAGAPAGWPRRWRRGGRDRHRPRLRRERARLRARAIAAAGAARPQSAGPRGIRRDRRAPPSLKRARLRAAAVGGAATARARPTAIIATDASLEPDGRAPPPAAPRADAHDPERHRPRRRSTALAGPGRRARSCGSATASAPGETVLAERRPPRSATRASTCSPRRSARAGAAGRAARGDRLALGHRRRRPVSGASIERAVDAHGLGAHVLFAGRASRRRSARVVRSGARSSCIRRATRAARSSRSRRWRIGSAVVATRAGGLPDKVRPGVNGWLVEPGDADGARARRSTTPLVARARLAAMGARSRAHRRARVRVVGARRPADRAVPTNSLRGTDGPIAQWPDSPIAR